jgi:large subunit ribosomal protein L9
MQVLLLNDVRKLGHLGDVVDVKIGYARNYLLPKRLATEPTEVNIAAIAEDKKNAALARDRKRDEFRALAEQFVDVSVTIEAQANPEGTLYGSVGAKEIGAALREAGHAVKNEHVALAAPIRTLDNVMVKLEFTEDITAQVKVWVVREGGTPDAEVSDDNDRHDDADDEAEDDD